MPLTKNLAQSSLKMPLKRLRFWDNSRLLTPYGCPEFIFVSGAGLGVQTVTRMLERRRERTTDRGHCNGHHCHKLRAPSANAHADVVQAAEEWAMAVNEEAA